MKPILQTLRLLCLLLFIVSFSVYRLSAQISISEDFDYGNTAGNLAGQNGGSGFASAWTGGSGGYIPSGLTFGAMSSPGGAQSGSGFTRQITTGFAATGPLSGSFLFQMTAPTSPGNVEMLGLGTVASWNNQNHYFGLMPANDGQSGKPALGVKGSGISAMTGGATLTQGTTYMFAFSYDNGSTSAWILSLSQYNNFFNGTTLDQAAMNTASIGTGASNITGKVTLATSASNLATMNYIYTYWFSGGSMTIDRIRMSGTAALSGLESAVPGAALNFDGVNDYVIIPHASSLNLSNNHTIEFWLKYSGTSFCYLSRKEGAQGVDLQAGGTTITHITWGDDASYTNGLLNDGNWHHYALVASGGNLRKLYRDGVLFGTNTDTYIMDQSSNPMYLGFTSSPAVMNLDEFRIWNRTLCESEIQAHMNCELAGSETDLVAYYKFNQGIAASNNTALTNLTDATTNGNHGTFNNVALNGSSSNFITPGGVTTGTSCSPLVEPEIDVQGNSISIADGSTTVSSTNNTDYGNVIVGQTLSKTFSIYNNGASPLTMSSITSSNGKFTIGTLTPSSTIAAGSSSTFTVSFAPTVSSIENSTITINNNDCDESVYDFAVKGTGQTAQTSLSINGSSTSLLGSVTTFTATLTRVSAPAGALAGESVIFTITRPNGSTQSFVVITNSLGQATITFTSTVVGEHSISASFSNLAAGLETSNSTPLSHTVTAPEINVQGNGQNIVAGDATPIVTDHTDFGNVSIGSNLVRTFTIQNTGSALLTISNIVSNNLTFAIGSFPASIAAGNSATFTITFSPVVVGIQNANIIIFNNDADEGGYNFAITGNGQCSSTLWYLDADNDGLGDAANPISSCTQPVGYVANNTDACPNANQSTLANFNPTSCGCNVGYYQGTTTNMGQTIIISCTICPVGKYCPDGVNAIDCAAGQYSDITGATSCIPCAAGYYNSSTGATSCLPCSAGSYSSSTGATSCTSCAAGTSNPLQGQTSCAACGINSCSPLQGSTTCTPCAAGFYAPISGSVSCTPCPTITFNETHAIACIGTTSGSFTIGNENGGSGPYTYSIDNGANYQSGTTFINLAPGIYTLKIKDVYGCESGSVSVNINDTEAPTLTNPGNKSFNTLSNSCDTTYTIVDPITDNCSGATWGYTLSGATTATVSGIADGSNASNVSFNKGVTMVTLTGIDASANAAINISFTITVKDIQAPTIVCTGQVTIGNTTGLCTGTTTLTAPTASDNCTATFGNALDFDGTNDKVTAANTGLPIGNANRTVEFWVKLFNSNSVNAVTYGTNTNNQQFSCSIYNNGGLMRPTMWGSFHDVNSTTLSVPLNTWTHVAYVYNGTTLTFYVNGIADAKAFSVLNTTSTLPLTLGAHFDNAHFQMDEVRIWNTARTQTEIQANMRTEITGSETGLVSYYKFNQGTPAGTNTGITTATATTGLNGTLNNFALSGSTSNWISGITFPILSNNAPATYPKGITTVTWTGTDASGNTATCTQVVTVNDTQIPTLVAPANQSLNVITNTCAANYTITDPISDNCTGATWGYTLSGATTATVTSIADGSNALNVSFNRGLTRVTLTGLDASGNVASTVFFNVTVLDNISPTIITCPTNLSLNSNLYGCYAITSLTPPVFTDNCALNLGNALNFDGTDDRVSQTFFARPTNHTIEAWVKLTANGPRTIASWGSNSSLTSASLVIDAGFIRYYQYSSGYQSFGGFFGQAINDNTWHHVAITIAGVGGIASFNIYLDGNLASSYSGSLPSLTFDNFNIGANSNWNWFYQGDMDEVRVWNVARTANQIKSNYLKELPGTTANLILCHKFNQNVAAGNNTGTVNVLATSGSNGVLSNFTLTGATSNFVSSTSINNVTNNAPSLFPIGNTTVTWTVADVEGNTATCNQIVNVVDSTAPTITCPAPLTINTDIDQCTANTMLASPVVSDNCSYNLQNALNFDGINDAVNCGTGFGNFGTGNFTIEGWFKSSNISGEKYLICKRPICGHASFWNIKTNAGRIQFEVDENASGLNYFSLISPIVHTNGQWNHFACIRSGNSLKIYINGVLATSANTSGIANLSNSASVILGQNPCGPYQGNLDELRVWNVARTITEIQQNMSAELSAQAGLLAYYKFNHGASGGNNSGLTTLTDYSGNNFHGTLSDFALNGSTSNWIYEPTSGTPPVLVTNNAPSTFPKGNTTVTWTATDGVGNSATCSQIVTVIDNQKPSISCPTSITVNNDNTICGAVVNFTTPVGTDNCIGATTLQTEGLASGSIFPIGVTINKFIVTDASGNKDSCSFTVTVIDNQKPIISCPLPITVNNDNNDCGAVVNYTTPIGTDNCSNSTTVQTEGLASGTIFPIGVTINKFIVMDASGNKDSCSFAVTVLDNQKPIISCPLPISVSNDNNGCGAIVNYTSPIGTDNCSGATTVQTEGLASGSTFPNGVTVNKFVVTDASGNKDSCSFTITVTGFSLRAKALLDGPFVPSLGLMHDSLRVYGLVPTLEPYSVPPFNRTPINESGGETVSSTLLSISGNNAIVDWVLLELRSASNPTIVLANKRALIQRDGDIVSSVDGVSPVFFANMLAGNYYVSLKHRNHLGVMSSNPISIGGCPIPSLDFTSGTVYVSSLVSNAPRKQVGALYTLWPADNNFNKNVKYNGLSSDKDAVLNSLGGAAFTNATLSNVYRAEDGNMDGKIRYNNADNDRVLLLNTVGVNTPNAILNQHTPN